MNEVFKALLVTGARQVGKSTMLRHLAENTGRTFVSMDDKRNRELARKDPGLFFQIYKTPAFDVLNVSSNDLGKGLVICMTDRTFPINENNYMVPASIL